MTASRTNMRRKMALILIVTLLCFGAVFIKLFVLQIVQGNDLQARAEEARTRDVTVAAARGTVYDVNGNKLAISVTADSIGAYPAQVKASEHLDDTASMLAGYLGKDKEELAEQLSADASFVWVKRKVDFDTADLIKAEILAAEYVTGLSIVEETQRFYPRGTLASHILGFAGIDNQGLAGIELSLEKYLVGTDGRIVGKYDAHNQAIPQEEYDYIPPEDGNDVYLTLDENVQFFCERELAALMASDTPPKRAGVIIMNPNTGAILGMASSEIFDPNNYSDYDETMWSNFLVNSSYEPGSTFKIITLATALEEGAVTANSSFYCGGAVRVANANIHCWASVPHGSQSLAEAVQNSCNPAFVAVGQSIENKQSGLFYDYIHAFGYGSPTGVQLPGEEAGILQAEENVNAVEIATIAIGQGIAVTPIQMITAVSAVANGGTLMQPQIVSKVMNGNEVIYTQEPEAVRRVVSEETAALVREMLVNVVTDGSGANAAIEGYTIGGKTGTAQKPGAGGYAAGKYVSSFIGMVPAESPELVCLVVVDEPSGVYYGSQVAAPLFKSIMSDVVRYMGIAPDANARDGMDTQNQESREVQVPNVINLDVTSAKARLYDAGLNVSIEGNGPLVTSQTPAGLSYSTTGNSVSLYTGGVSTAADGSTQVTVPNLIGKRFAEVANLLAALGLSLSAEGNGIANYQSVAAGQTVSSGTSIRVVFQEEKKETEQTVPVLAP